MMNRIENILDQLGSDINQSPAFYVWISILTVLVGLGAYALLMSLIHSLEVFELSLKIPWGMMVSNYIFLIGSSTGLCMVASLGYVFGLERYKMIGKRALFMSLFAIIFGMASIVLHLGHPERSVIYTLLTPNVLSAMWWMGGIYGVYIVTLSLWCWILLRDDLLKGAANTEGLKAGIFRLIAFDGFLDYLKGKFPQSRWLLGKLAPLFDTEDVELKWARVLGALTLVSGLCAYIVEGSLFAHVEARAFWYGALTPIFFLLGAALCGVSWILAAGIITYKVRGETMPDVLEDLFYEIARILAVLLSLAFLAIVYKMSHGLLEPNKAPTVLLFLKGPFSLAFWLVEIIIGLVLPVSILLYASRKKKISGVMIAAVMALVGYFVKRYDYVVASQVYPVLKKSLPSYLPTFIEVLLVMGLLGAFLLIYTLGDRFLPLKGKDYSNVL